MLRLDILVFIDICVRHKIALVFGLRPLDLLRGATLTVDTFFDKVAVPS